MNRIMPKMKALVGTINRSVYLPVMLIFFLLACQIEDDHGTLENVLLANELVPIKGEPLGEYYTIENFIVNSQAKEIYFLNCSGLYGICENNIITSLNFQTGATKKIYESPAGTGIILIDFIPQSNTLYFSTQTSQNLIALDLITLQHKVIYSGTEFWNYSLNEEFLFINYEYGSLFIKKIDGLGNEEILTARGKIILASQSKPEILVQSQNDNEYFIYDYESDSITFSKSMNFGISRFYKWFDDLLYLSEYPLAIRNFKTDAIIFNLPSSSLYIADFNPVCRNVAHIEEKPISKSLGNFQILNYQLMVNDLNTGETSIAVSLYNEWINQVKIQDDGNTIIYTSGDKLYLATIE